jgi:predicted MFS family arabinose efflux permease
VTTTTPRIERRRTTPIWLLLVAGSVITSLSLGVRSTFGLFLDPVVDTIGSGRGAFALAIAVQNLLWGLSQPVAGAIADRFGTARVLAGGAVAYAAGLVLMAGSTSTGALVLSTGVVIGVANGAASFAVVLAAVGRMVPPARRSMALGVVSAMGSVGQFVLVPLARWLIDSAGWEETAVALAAVVLAVAVFAPWLRGRSIDQALAAGPGTDHPPSPLATELRRAGHSRSYRLLNLAFFVCGFHVTFIATHLASYSEDVGQTRAVAATALALIGLFNIAGSLAAGALGARFSKSRLLSIIYAGRAVVIAAFVLLPVSPTAIVVFGAAIGLLWLATVPLTSAIVVGQFGTSHAGTLFGIVFLSHQLGAFVGAWMGGTLADRLGSYGPVWWVAVGLGVFAALLHLVIDERPQPEPPPRLAVAPRLLGPAAAVLLAAGLTVGAASAAARTEQGAVDGDRSPSFFCVLHPVLLEDS